MHVFPCRRRRNPLWNIRVGQHSVCGISFYEEWSNVSVLCQLRHRSGCVHSRCRLICFRYPRLNSKHVIYMLLMSTTDRVAGIHTVLTINLVTLYYLGLLVSVYFSCFSRTKNYECLSQDPLGLAPNLVNRMKHVERDTIINS